jgi:hypothetical protein
MQRNAFNRAEVHMTEVYQHDYQELSVYGNVMTLLREHAGKQGVHIDIGCGYGAIAERVRYDLGLSYIGFDRADDGMSSLRDRGFPVHDFDLLNIDAAEATIRGAIGGRQVAALTMIDVLEHVTNLVDVLAMLRRLADDHQSPLVVSVPNVTHKDIAIKSLLGRWDWTEAGLLDFTHVGFFNEGHLTDVAAQAGWRQVAAKDWLLEQSDQFFPSDLALLHVGSPVGEFLRTLAGQANPDCIVNQFVRAYLPSDKAARKAFPSREPPLAPFLTIVTRTQGHRNFHLREMLLSLAGQSVDDFDLIIVCHKCDSSPVRELVSSFPKSLIGKVRTIDCASEGRAAPLNAAIPHIDGRYVAFLDDDDIVFGHYVETFERLANANPGQMIRANCATQQNEWRPDSALGPHVTAASWFETPYAHRYNAVEQLRENSTPFMSVAFPASVFRDLRLRFDESLTTTEDWHFICRAAQYCGVADASAVTAIYRRWLNGINSEIIHDIDEWVANRERVIQGMNSAPLLLPPWSAGRIIDLIEGKAAAEAGWATCEVARAAAEAGWATCEVARAAAEAGWATCEAARAAAEAGWATCEAARAAAEAGWATCEAAKAAAEAGWATCEAARAAAAAGWATCEAARVAAEARAAEWQVAAAHANECQLLLRTMMRRFRFVKFLWPKKCFVWYFKMKNAARFAAAATG